MHTLKSLLLTCLALLAVSPNASADGLITRLPDDGSWAEFELKLTLTKNDQKREHSAYLRLSSVGQGEHQGTKCGWVELQVSRTEPPQPDEVAKILVLEESLKSGKVTAARLSYEFGVVSAPVAQHLRRADKGKMGGKRCH